MDEELEILIATLKDSLKQGKCVLVLGPDLYIKEIDNQVWERKEFYLSLEKQLECTFFPNDEVFKTEKRFSLQQRIKDYFTGGGDIQLIESISKIRFPLILNASPDESLYVYLHSIDNTVQCDYFEGEQDEKKVILFDRSKPLIYNTFGKASDPQSLIICHDILYRRMQQLLPENSFPVTIREFLKNASSFLFVGFKFDSWAYQLLSFKIVSQGAIDRNKIRLSSSRYTKDNMVNVIMTEALGMSFTNVPPVQILNRLFDALEEDQPNNFKRVLGSDDKLTSFLSYNRKNGDFVTGFIKRFGEIVIEENKRLNESAQLKLLYDKQDLRFGQSIDSFMTRIGKGKTVVLIVGEYYLDSDYCMVEALRTNIYHREDDRVFIIVIRNGLQQDLSKKDNLSNAIAHYQDHWDNKLAALVSKGNKPDKDLVVNYLDIRDFIPDFIKKLSDTNNHFVDTDKILEDELDKFIKQLIQKMKED